MFDLDNFKSVNDMHGHHAGDTVLRDCAAALKRHTRVTDLVARYGGDEFLVLLPETDLAEAYEAAEKMRSGHCRAAVLIAHGKYRRRMLAQGGYARGNARPRGQSPV